MFAAARALDAGQTTMQPVHILEALISDETLVPVLVSLGLDVDAVRDWLHSITEPNVNPAESTYMSMGIVKIWNEDDGWGIITSSEVPGEVWAHFSHIDAEGYRSLEVGERVQFKWLQLAPPGQDGYLYRATRVVRSPG
jgi:cold shock protein